MPVVNAMGNLGISCNIGGSIDDIDAEIEDLVIVFVGEHMEAKGMQTNDFVCQTDDIDMIVDINDIQVGVPGPNAQSVTSADDDADVNVEEGETVEVVDYTGMQDAITTAGRGTRALDARRGEAVAAIHGSFGYVDADPRIPSFQYCKG